MRKPLALAIAATLGTTLTLSVLAAEEATTIQEAIKGGTVDLNLRMRYEEVDQNNARDDASALTLKTRLTYTTQSYKNFQGLIEVDNTSELVDENHCDLDSDNPNDLCAAGADQHSVIADPEGSEVNQAWLAYTGLENTTIKHGRQRVNLDNQRFVGGVAWRQNEQTYDATAVINTSIPDTTIVAAYVKGVNDIFENDIDTDSTLLNVSYIGLSFAKVAVYNYDIETDGTDTTGIRLTGSPEIAGVKVNYELEYAKQNKEVVGSSDYDTKYTHVALGTAVGPVNVKIGQEVLGSDQSNFGFSTVLATKHKFNGFADTFLGTPGDGLQDEYLTLSGKCPLTGAKITVTYHDFDADNGSADYGDEIDIAITKKIKGVNLLLKYADYDMGDTMAQGAAKGTVDTQKLWLQAQVAF
jgi:hypothetical protein